MPRPLTPESFMTTTLVKENKPAWCSPGYSRSTLIRPGKARPLREVRPANWGPIADAEQQQQRPEASKGLQTTKKVQSQQLRDNPSPGSRAKTMRSASPQVAGLADVSVVQVHNLSTIALATARAKAARAPVTEETPPRSRPLNKKAPAILATPTNKTKKTPATVTTPKGNFLKSGSNGSGSGSNNPEGITPQNSSASASAPKSSTPKGNTPIGTTAAAKGSSPSGRAKERSNGGHRGITKHETPPSRKVKNRPEAPKSGGRTKEKIQHTLSAWAAAAAGGRVTTRKPSPTRTRAGAPVKHLFLSPQGSRKTSKKDNPLRKSVDSHGIWIGSVPLVGGGAAEGLRGAGTEARTGKHDVDSQMPPPAQPTNSPELPKRGSRETSGEGIRGYFGAGPMVGPDGLGFVRDRRKCKPRGTLLVGDECHSMDSDSSSSAAVEFSTQMPLPSVASVEWMTNNRRATDGSLAAPGGQSSGSKQSDSISLPDFFVRENLARESLRKESSSREVSSHGLFLRQLRLSKAANNCEVNYQHARRSQAFLQHLRQSQASSRQPSHHGSEDGFITQCGEDVTDFDMEHEDITIDWRQGLPCESMEVVPSRSGPGLPGRKSDELMESSISFSTSWVPPLAPAADGKAAGRLDAGNVGTLYTPSESPSWYGFSPITPEFQRNSQLPEGGSKAIDALVAAGSVRRRIMPVQGASSESSKLQCSSTSVTESMQLVNAGDDSAASNVSAHSSQETSSSFQFATRNSLVSSSSFVAMPSESFVFRTSSPVGNHRQSMFGVDDLLCQTASPINEIYGDREECSGSDVNLAGGSEDCSLDGSIVDGVGGDGHGRDKALDSDDEMEYASPLVGDYLSPEKRSSPREESVKFEKNCGIDLSRPGIGEVVNPGARAGRRSSINRRSSISKTLEELMRHNFHF